MEKYKTAWKNYLGLAPAKEQKYSHYDAHENSFKKTQEMSLGVSDHTSSGIF